MAKIRWISVEHNHYRLSLHRIETIVDRLKTFADTVGQCPDGFKNICSCIEDWDVLHPPEVDSHRGSKKVHYAGNSQNAFNRPTYILLKSLPEDPFSNRVKFTTPSVPNSLRIVRVYTYKYVSFFEIGCIPALRNGRVIVNLA